MSIFISTGFEAEYSVNCDNAVAIGSEQHNQMMKAEFDDLKLKRKSVRPLSAMCPTVKVRKEALVFNEQPMLNRILTLLQRSRDLRDFLQYEFVSFVPTLFNDVSMYFRHKNLL